MPHFQNLRLNRIGMKPQTVSGKRRRIQRIKRPYHGEA
jgi:hypothetical protein